MSLATRFHAGTRVGRILRMPLRVVRPGALTRVLIGPNRGFRWTIGAGPHSCWIGNYEPSCTRAFMRAVRPGDVVYDLGANVGYYSLAAARRVGPHGRVIAFEPLPDVADVLERHLAVNGIRNVTVERCAVSDEDGEAWFDPGVGSAYGRLSETGRIRVPTVSLDRFCAARGLPLPNVVKIDVEGAELQALRGAVGILRRARPRVMLSLHTAEMQRECPALLASLGYEFVAVDPWKGMGADSGTFLAEPAPR